MKNFELEYKSALGTATTMYACAKESNDREMIQSLELIFPELKKSKDELIREEILNCFVEMKKQGCFPSKHKEQYDSWIEWLEKQDKQKQVSITDEWIENYWQHEKVNNPYSYNKGDKIQFDHQGFVKFCKRYCQKPIS